MTGWWKGTLAAFDLATNGADPEEARIVTACVMKVDGSGQDKPIASTWPDNSPAEEVIAETTALLVRGLRAGVPFVAFDLSRQLTVLDRECRRHGLPTATELLDGAIRPVICARVLDGYASRRTEDRSLIECCDRWDVRLKDPGDVAWRAFSAAGLVVRIAQRNPSIARMTLPDLHAAQAKWNHEQCMEHARFLRRTAAHGTEGRTVEDQLDLHAQAKHAEAEAGHWPITPFQQQGALT